MIEPIEKKRIIVDLLEQVLSGELKPDEAISRWPDAENESNPIYTNAWHNLYHFSVDTDIQSKDPEYKEHQENLIRSNLSEIKAEEEPA